MTLETIWEVPDELWERIEPFILEEDPPARGRKRSDPRQMLAAITIRLRSARQWNRLPERAWGRQHHSSHLSNVGPISTASLVTECPPSPGAATANQLDGVDWELSGGRRSRRASPRFGGT